MKGSLNSLSTVALVAVVVALGTPGALATNEPPAIGPYVVTNDDVFTDPGGNNTATVFSIAANGSLTLKKTIGTKGTGSGGGFFATGRVNVLHSKTQACTYVSDSNPNFTTATIPDVAGINLKTLKLAGAFPAGSSDNGSNFGVGLADAGTFLVALFTGGGPSSLPPTIGTYKILAGCKLKYIGSISASGMNGGSPDGAKVTPDGKTVVVAYADGSVGSYRIKSTGKLALIGQELTSTGAFAAGVDITADGKWAIFGDASTTPSVDVAPITAGVLGPTVNYLGLVPGINSNNVLLSPDETVLYISNNFDGAIAAVSFNKTTGVLKPKKSCSSNVLRNFGTSWFFGSALAFAKTTGSGKYVYLAEFGFPSGIGIVKFQPHVKGEDEFCDLTETAASPASDPASQGLISIGSYPPRPF